MGEEELEVNWRKKGEWRNGNGEMVTVTKILQGAAGDDIILISNGGQTMSDILIRGLPPSTKREMEKVAREENLSVNQVAIRLLRQALAEGRKAEDEEKRRGDWFRRLNEFREELHRKYGKFDDSTKLIREDRETH